MGFLGVTLWGTATGKGTWGCLQIESHPFMWPLSVPISSSFPTGSTPSPPPPPDQHHPTSRGPHVAHLSLPLVQGDVSMQTINWGRGFESIALPTPPPFLSHKLVCFREGRFLALLHSPAP